MTSLRPLHSGWTVSLTDRAAAAPADLPGSIPAAVPGCVHTDLLAAGLIPDPYLDDNENGLTWIGRSGWSYETTFAWAGDGAGGAARTDLVCAGLDTVATVRLNGIELGTTANQHRSYRFDARDALRPGNNRLTVSFGSTYAYAERVRDAVGSRPAAYDEPFQYIRKSACNFGWDWGPTLVTAGIWRPIGLESWSVARLARVRPEVSVGPDGTGEVRVLVDVERAGTDGAGSDEAVTVSVTVAGVRGETRLEVGEGSGVVAVSVPAPRLWWPRGLGEQHRYPLDVTLTADDTGPAVLDHWTRQVGFRTVELDTTPDADGTAFAVKINGVPVFARGYNWIPDDVFANRVTRERCAQRLRQAVDGGANFLRIWGGGLYESEDFYDLCDELGIMVGQDFLFACAAYPEEEPLASEVVAEAREQVVRLMPHPSLVWWCGNNENIWGYHDWGWPAKLEGRTWGEGYYLDVLPRIVAELDPTRPYWPGSPYSGSADSGGTDLHPNDPAHGSMHIWDVWNREDYTKYREYRPRFVAEFGFQAPATYATLRAAVSDEPLEPESPALLHHQKADDGQGKLARGLAPHFPEPADFDSWLWATQLNQARAMAFGVEHFRSLRPLCMGTIVWQLNDCWPVTSWAAVDGAGRRKPLWYALRGAFAERLVTIQPREAGPADGGPADGGPAAGGPADGGLAVVAVNDSATRWRTQFDVVRTSFAGTPLAKVTVSLEVEPGGTSTVPLPSEVATPDQPAAELLLADTDTGRATWFFAEDRDLHYPAPGYDVSSTPVEGGHVVTVAARTLLRDLTLFPDRVHPDASVDRQLVTLLPGESTTLTVHTDQPLDAAALARPPILRCANDLVRSTVRH